MLTSTQITDLNLDFTDLEPQKTRVPIGKKVYWLFEASGDAATKYRNASLKGARIEEGRTLSTMEGIADAEVILVANCLYQATETGDPPVTQNGNPDPSKRVGELQIRAWPGRVQKALYEAVHKLSPWLRERETPDPKASVNGHGMPPEPTTATSDSPTDSSGH